MVKGKRKTNRKNGGGAGEKPGNIGMKLGK